MNSVAQELTAALAGYNQTGRIDTDAVQQAIDEINRLQQIEDDADEYDRILREMN